MTFQLPSKRSTKRSLWSHLRAILFLAGVVVISGVVGLYFEQHRIIYHPRPYEERAIREFQGVELPYVTPAGRQVAFYLPQKSENAPPRRVWVAFCGNGSLALDWTGFIAGDPNGGDAFLLVDYPGYGKNEGYATIDSMRVSADKAVVALAEHLGVSEKEIEQHLSVIGHSLGSAVALDFATRHPVQRVVAIAPFTSLEEEAATVVGTTFSKLLIENYDNRARLSELAKDPAPPRIAIFHGTEDEVIPVRMGRALGDSFPRFVQFFEIPNADHVSVLYLARDKILGWMNQ